MPTALDKFTEGHALLVAGYIDEIGDHSGHFIIRNSWGTDWGDVGYGYLPYEYVRQYGRRVWLAGVP
jgi:C1A family cysteine protease